MTLERPPLNVLDLGLLRELDQVLSDCGADTRIDIVVPQGAGFLAEEKAARESSLILPREAHRSFVLVVPPDRVHSVL